METKRPITIVIDGNTAYNVGQDFRNFVARGAEDAMLSTVAALYPSATCYTVLSRMHGTVDVFAPTGWICETLGAAFDAVRTIMGSN